jgi:hypothetical protein
MAVYETDNFGRIFIQKPFENIELEYKNKKILVRFLNFDNVSYDDTFWSCGIDIAMKFIDIKSEYMKRCVESINQYPYIDEDARNFFIENYKNNKTIKKCFGDYFNNFDEDQILKIFGVKISDEYDIRSIVGKFDYPDLCFEYDHGHIITIVDYKVADLCPENIIGVEMDDSLDIIAYGKAVETK